MVSASDADTSRTWNTIWSIASSRAWSMRTSRLLTSARGLPFRLSSASARSARTARAVPARSSLARIQSACAGGDSDSTASPTSRSRWATSRWNALIRAPAAPLESCGAMSTLMRRPVTTPTAICTR